jgi:hypothetical protein
MERLTNEVVMQQKTEQLPIKQLLGSIRIYSSLFDQKLHGINISVGVAFFIAMLLAKVTWIIWPFGIPTIFYSPLIQFYFSGIIVDVVISLFFVIVSHSISSRFLLPVAYGLVFSLANIGGRAIRPAFYYHVMDQMRLPVAFDIQYITADMLFGLCFMAGLMIAIKTWGVKLWSLIVGLVCAYLINYFLFQILSFVFFAHYFYVSTTPIKINIINNTIMGALLYGGFYFHLMQKRILPISVESKTSLDNKLSTVMLNTKTSKAKMLINEGSDVNADKNDVRTVLFLFNADNPPAKSGFTYGALAETKLIKHLFNCWQELMKRPIEKTELKACHGDLFEEHILGGNFCTLPFLGEMAKRAEVKTNYLDYEFSSSLLKGRSVGFIPWVVGISPLPNTVSSEMNNRLKQEFPQFYLGMIEFPASYELEAMAERLFLLRNMRIRDGQLVGEWVGWLEEE